MDNNLHIARIFDRQGENGGPFWSRLDGDIYHPSGHSTVDTLYVLGDLGATPNEYPILLDAVNFLFQRQARDGAFKYGKRSSKLPCITARIIAAIAQLELSFVDALENSYQHLFDIQCTDGGWRCNTVKKGKSQQTDASNPGTTLYALDAFRFRNNAKTEMSKLNRGVDFLLDHWDSRKPLGPCTFGIGTRFFQIEYPFLRYNLFYYVYILSFYKVAQQDQRFKNAYHTLVEKTQDGMIILENPHKSWSMFDFARKGKSSAVATQKFQQIMDASPITSKI